MSSIRHLALQQRLLNTLILKHRPNPFLTRYTSLTRPRFPPPTSRRLQSTTTQPSPLPAQPLTTPLNQPPTQPRPRILRRILTSLLTATIFLTLGIYIGWETLPTRSIIASLLRPPPSDAESLAAYTPPDPTSAAINNHIVNHPLAQSLRTHHPDLRESRPHLKIPEALRVTNLTGGTLAGPGKIVVPPLTFIAPDGSVLVSLFYLGENLCGHPGIIHGGLLATLLDEGLARCCFPAMPNGVAVTASLKVEYKRPVMAGDYYVLVARTERVEGRKAWVGGWIGKLDAKGAEGLGGMEGVGRRDVVKELLAEGMGKDGSGVVSLGGEAGREKLVTASALFIEPRNASMMKKIYNVD